MWEDIFVGCQRCHLRFFFLGVFHVPSFLLCVSSPIYLHNQEKTQLSKPFFATKFLENIHPSKKTLLKVNPVPSDFFTCPSMHAGGYHWLVNNVRNGLGCILADDMGLGKTLQVGSLFQGTRQLIEVQGLGNGFPNMIRVGWFTRKKPWTYVQQSFCCSSLVKFITFWSSLGHLGEV